MMHSDDFAVGDPGCIDLMVRLSIERMTLVMNM